jgi:hypothetical protein
VPGTCRKSLPALHSNQLEHLSSSCQHAAAELAFAIQATFLLFVIRTLNSMYAIKIHTYLNQALLVQALFDIVTC